MKFSCPHCGQRLECEEEYQGKKVQCPACKKGFIINEPIKGTAVSEHEYDSNEVSENIDPGKTVCTGRVIYKNIKDNPNLVLIGNMGCFSVYEHKHDMSSESSVAQLRYFMQKMNIRKRQVLAELNGNSIKMQAGAMQWISGNISCETGLGSGAKAVGNFMKGLVKGMASGESAVKPVYSGSGAVMLEPTYKYILLENPSTWGEQGVVLQDSLFLACDAQLQEKIVSRQNLSSILGAGEGLFNLAVSGDGTLVLESPVPREELFEFELDNGTLKIDGNMAIAWSATLQLTVERSSKTLLGSLVNKEGLVNVYRGTGKVLMTSTVYGTLMAGGTVPNNQSEGGSAVKGVISGLTKIVTD